MTEGPNEATPRLYPDATPDPGPRHPSVVAGVDIGPTAWPAIVSNLRRIPAASPPYPVRRDPRTHRVRLHSGDWVSIRPLCPQDAPALATAVERLSALSRYRRFHSALPRLTDEMITYFTEIDHHDHEALVAVLPGTGGIIVGVARFIRDPAHPDTAEVAVVVADSWQRRGLGTVLLRRLARRANEVGIRSSHRRHPGGEPPDHQARAAVGCPPHRQPRVDGDHLHRHHRGGSRRFRCRLRAEHTGGRRRRCWDCG